MTGTRITRLPVAVHAFLLSRPRSMPVSPRTQHPRFDRLCRHVKPPAAGCTSAQGRCLPQAIGTLRTCAATEASGCAHRQLKVGTRPAYASSWSRRLPRAYRRPPVVHKLRRGGACRRSAETARGSLCLSTTKLNPLAFTQECGPTQFSVNALNWRLITGGASDSPTRGTERSGIGVAMIDGTRPPRRSTRAAPNGWFRRPCARLFRASVAEVRRRFDIGATNVRRSTSASGWMRWSLR